MKSIFAIIVLPHQKISERLKILQKKLIQSNINVVFVMNIIRKKTRKDVIQMTKIYPRGIFDFYSRVYSSSYNLKGVCTM